MRKYLDAFIKGIASIFPFGYTEREARRILQQSDERALSHDWQAVGGDMYAAVAEYEQEYQ